MLLKSYDIEIVEDDPFRNDVLDRKESGEILKKFVLSTSDSVVICIDAPWGQGKTTFLKMWKQELKNDGIPTLYFNAWENDFSDDALVCLIGEIGVSIKELSRTGDESKAREYLDNVKRIGGSLLKRSVPIGAKVATAGLLDFDKITEQALAGFAETIAKEQLEKYENSKNSIKNFRETISSLASSITDPKEPKSLVFIIDELDRCRPNYAIEVLEKAKHLFNVNNIIFVLGADKEQLGSSIKSIYGKDIDVNGYLRKFMDFEYVLPLPDKGKFVKSLFEKYSFNNYFSKIKTKNLQYEGRHSLSMFTELFEVYGLTLREQEYCCSLLSVAIRLSPENDKLLPVFLCFLIVLKVKDVETYKELVNERIGPSGILDKLNAMPEAANLLSSNYGAGLEAHIVSCKEYDFNEIYEKYEKIKNSELSDEKEKNRALKIQEIIAGFSWDYEINSLGYLINKIEIASRFKT